MYRVAYRVTNAFVYDEVSLKKFSEEELRHGYRTVLRRAANNSPGKESN